MRVRLPVVLLLFAAALPGCSCRYIPPGERESSVTWVAAPSVADAPALHLASAPASSYTLGETTNVTPLTVRVEDAVGRPVGGAQVLLVAGYAVDMGGGCGLVGAEQVAEGVSGPGGRFRAAPRLSKSVMCIDAAALREGDSGASKRVFKDRIGKDEIVVVLAPGVSYSGRVVDKAGRGVPGASVECNFRGNDILLRCPTSPDGSFRCGPVPAGETGDARISAVHRGPAGEAWSGSVQGAALSPDREIVLVVDPIPDIPANRK